MLDNSESSKAKGIEFVCAWALMIAFSLTFLFLLGLAIKDVVF